MVVKQEIAPPLQRLRAKYIAPIDEIARTIWRDTYRHDTLLDWHEIKRNTLHWKRVMAAAEAVRYLLTQRKVS